jgi:hypothetical protein
VHCPYCHGWEVRDEPIGILATGPASIHHAWLFRQLTDDLIYFTCDTEPDADTHARFAARNIRIIETPVQEVVNDEAGASPACASRTGPSWSGASWPSPPRCRPAPRAWTG